MVTVNNAINNTVGATNSGVTNTLTVTNASNTASSQAQVNVTVGGTSAGDAYTTYTVAGTTNWSEGVDNSDSDAYVLAASTALGTTNVMRSSTSGAITKPLTPCVYAYLSATQANATGDGTQYTIIFDTEVFDQNSNFNPATGTFTAPVTGKYLITGLVSFSGLGTSNSFGVSIVATSRTLISMSTNAVNGGNNFVYIPYTAILDMTATDTFVIKATAFSGAKNIGIIGGANNGTSVQVALLC